VAAVPVLAAGVLGAEVMLAQRGERLGDAPLALDGIVDGNEGGPALAVTWLGDSTAAGVGASKPGTALPRLVAAGLDRPVDLTVLAVSGDRVGDVLDGQLPELGRVDLVLISVGANDVTHLTRRSTFERQYAGLLAGIPDGVEVVALGVPDMGAVPRFAQPLRTVAGWRGRQLATSVQEVGEAAGARFVDIAGETGPVFRRDPGRSFAGDRYHPSDEGYRRWAEAVLAVLSDLRR